MPVRGWSVVGRLIVFLSLLLPIGCESADKVFALRPGGNRGRRAAAIASARLARDAAPDDQSQGAAVPARPVGPTTAQAAPDPAEVHTHIPDPVDIAGVLERELASRLEEIDRKKWTPEDKEREKANLRAEYEQRGQAVLKRVEEISRPNKVRLGLNDAIRRALKNNYLIQTHSYSPAIEAARIVEAEAQFDAVYFANFTNTKQDTPSPSELVGTQMQNRQFESGVRKLLSAGTQVQVSYALTRQESDLVFQTLNPAYDNDFIVELRQPFLRGFGLDFNRSEIELRRMERDIGLEKLKEEIQNRIFEVVRNYWWQVHNRRRVVVLARLLHEWETILADLEKRGGYDAYGVQINLVRSRLEMRQADFQIAKALVWNNEDLLKASINDPDLPIGQRVEIIPTDEPSIEPVGLDEVGEAAEAMVHSPLLRQTRLQIEQAELGIGVAKNQALPRLDAVFRYIVNGLGANADRAFSQLSQNDFHDYIVGVEFEWPIGNRGPEAALRRARLALAQAIASHRAAIEGVALDVISAIRGIQSAYDQISIVLEAARASKAQLRVTQARQEKRDPPSLTVELDAHEALASARERLLQVVVSDFSVSPGVAGGFGPGVGGYNDRLIDLERRKGTLLRYYNIVIRGADDESYLKPYRPVGP